MLNIRNRNQALLHATREFLHLDDLARACLYVMEHYEGEAFLNAGVGEDVSIRELAELVHGSWVSKAASPGTSASPMAPRASCWT